MVHPTPLRIIVTGGRGYLGTPLVKALRDRGHEVLVVDLEWYNIEKHEPHSVRDLTEDTLKDVDVVIHLAWFSSAGNTFPELQLYSLDNTTRLVDACRNSDTRLIFASTASVNGFTQTPDPVTEEYTPTPVCSYGRAKLEAELYIRRNMGDFVILRMGTLMGYMGAGRVRLDILVNAMVASGLADERIKVWNGSSYRPLLHVKDAVNVFVSVAEDRKHCGEIYNLAGYNLSVRSVAYRVAVALGEIRDVIVDEQGENDADARSYLLNCEKARKAGILTNEGSIDDVANELGHICHLDPTTRNVPWISQLLAQGYKVDV